MEAKTSKLQRALDLVAQGVKPYTAAQREGVTPGHVYAALKRQRERLETGEIKVCPCCKKPW